jgi:hypothetical protein
MNNVDFLSGRRTRRAGVQKAYSTSLSRRELSRPGTPEALLASVRVFEFVDLAKLHTAPLVEYELCQTIPVVYCHIEGLRIVHLYEQFASVATIQDPLDNPKAKAFLRRATVSDPGPVVWRKLHRQPTRQQSAVARVNVHTALPVFWTQYHLEIYGGIAVVGIDGQSKAAGLIVQKLDLNFGSQLHFRAPM